MTPNGCRHCGSKERGHFQRWSSTAGRHGFTEPTDEQRLARMLARRAKTLHSKKAPAGASAEASTSPKGSSS